MKRKIGKVFLLSAVIMAIVCLFSACLEMNDDKYSGTGEEETKQSFGKFYTLEAAYGDRLISTEALQNFAALYNGETTSEAVVDEYARTLIKTDFVEERSVKESEVDISFYGEYNGAYFVSINGSGAEASDENVIDIAEIRINQRDGDEIKVWAISGGFFTLREAYDNGLISLSSINSIADCYGGNDEAVADNLNSITEKSIRRDWLINNCHLGEEKGDIDKVTLEGYFGTYNGCIAVYITDEYNDYAASEDIETIGGVDFYYSSGNRIWIWKTNF